LTPGPPLRYNGAVMWVRDIILGAVAVVGLLTVVAVGACGGDDNEPTLYTYFQDIQSISNRANTRFAPLQEEIEKDFGSESEELAAWRDFFAADLRIVEDYLEELANVRTPDAVRDQHDQFVSSGSTLFEALSQTNTAIANVKSKVELEELLASQTLEEATSAFDDACRDLQGIADDRQIVVNLDCD
jgi:ABC-type transporter Mla subunit MlaD